MSNLIKAIFATWLVILLQACIPTGAIINLEDLDAEISKKIDDDTNFVLVVKASDKELYAYSDNHWSSKNDSPVDIVDGVTQIAVGDVNVLPSDSVNMHSFGKNAGFQVCLQKTGMSSLYNPCREYGNSWGGFDIFGAGCTNKFGNICTEYGLYQSTKKPPADDKPITPNCYTCVDNDVVVNNCNDCDFDSLNKCNNNCDKPKICKAVILH